MIPTRMETISTCEYPKVVISADKEDVGLGKTVPWDAKDLPIACSEQLSPSGSSEHPVFSHHYDRERFGSFTPPDN